MDISGLVVAASETIRLEKGNGKLITVYSLQADFHFYILVKEQLIESWDRVYTSHFYRFTHLKLAALELVSGAKKSVLETTVKSHFYEILEHEAQDFNYCSRNLIEKISVPGLPLERNGKAESKLISYEGAVTKVENSNLGLYELDNKIQLCCIFNSFRASLPVLREGVKIFVSNAHYFIDSWGTKVLVCCGLSSLRCMDSKAENTDPTLSLNLNQYFLSIYDVLWLQMLLKKLIFKFCPSIVSNELLFHLESKIVNKILECFTEIPDGLLVSNKKSLCEEYCSSPHSCSLFVDDILPTGCEILNIADILDDAFSNTWRKMSDSWETYCIKSSRKFILIGFLYLSKNGCWYLMDKSCNVPVVFLDNCDKCKSSKNISCLFNDLNIGYLIAVQNFNIVFEKIKHQYNNYYNCRYLKMSSCFLFNLGTFYKDSANTFQFISEQTPCNLRLNSDSKIDEITSMIEEIYLEKKDVTPSGRKNSQLASQDDIATCATQNILVLSKLWTIVEDKFVCYQVIALILPEKVDDGCFDRSKSLFANSKSFFENEDSDDEEFAELINQMDSLLFEDKPRLARFHFESTRQCALLMPGHMYVMNLSEKLNHEFQFLMECDKGNSKPLFMKIKLSVLITHNLHCLGNHEPEADIYCGIKQIISERKVQENSLIQAVLIDKLFEERNSTSQSEDCRNLTFCLVVQDCYSNDTLKVYLPFCPKNIYGFLPGTCLLMYGFVCVCSKRGNLYLVQSSSFGIQVLNTEESFLRDIWDTTIEPEKVSSDDDLSIASVRNISVGELFTCLCYIIKIVSAKVYLVCNSCSRGFGDKCPCLCSYSIQLNVSFVIDNGVDQIIASCSDETAKGILMFNEYEWKKLSSYVTSKMTSLKFHCKENNECGSSSLMNQIFSLYCSSKFLCRQIYVKCKKIAGGSKSDLQSIWCCDILKEHDLDLIPKLIKKVKNIDTSAR